MPTPSSAAEEAVSPKGLLVVPIEAPSPEVRARRAARFARDGEKRNRYHLPASLSSGSPVGYRTRVALSQPEAAEALALLALERPSAFVAGEAVTDQALFEECALGILSSRQSTNFRGHKATVLGPEDSARAAAMLRRLGGTAAPVLDGASHTHIVLTRPYRTAFTMLLTLAGHPPVISPLTVVGRIIKKRVFHGHDIPTIGYLQHLHLGILADSMERAAVIASGGRRMAQVHAAPFCGDRDQRDRSALGDLEALCGLSAVDKRLGWRIGLVAQVGAVAGAERPAVAPKTLRKVGANLLAFRSERILPGHNAEPKAPAQYHGEQGMRVREELVVMTGRAGYNAFGHWTGIDREQSKALLLLDRIDVLTGAGGKRTREISAELNHVTDRLIKDMPLWAELPTGRAFSRNAERGRKAFGLVGQRIYVSGLSQPEIAAAGLDWERAVRAVGASAARSSLYVELMGCVDLPDDADLLAGICMMAGPVNQNDIGKQFYGFEDLLKSTHTDRDPTSLLVWTLKAKTVADPVGNEEQLLNPKRKGALVDLRMAPHEAIRVRRDGALEAFRQGDGATNNERAFADLDNFVRDPDGRPIPGNEGEPWPEGWRAAALW